MTDQPSHSPHTPNISPEKTDDLIASYGREPTEKDMDMIQSMIHAERTKQQVREKLKMQEETRNNRRGKSRGR